MPRQRIFWKLFLSFWAALLLFALGVLYAASAYLDATRDRYDTANPRERSEAVFVTAQAAASQGFEPLREWARHVDDSELVPVLLLTPQGQDILGREPSARALARLTYVTKNYTSDKTDKRFPLVLPDGREYWLVPDFQSATLGRLISRPRVVATQLVLATLIAAAVCLLLAGYLTAPLKRLRDAALAYGSGDFSQRVAPSLGRRNDEIVDLARSLDTMAGRIDDLINAQRGLLRDVSHELRSPLARVQVALGLARQRSGHQTDAELTRIDEEMDKLNELIGRIIDFSRLDAGLMTLRPELLQLDQLIAHAISDAQLEADHKQCRIDATLMPNASFEGDAQLLASAVENILRNAVRHSPADSRVVVTLEASEQAWLLTISDQGTGIPAEHLARVFEPFFRVDDHRNPQGGIGLGLAIAQQAIAAHGGHITLNNLVPNGLQVQLQLPWKHAS